MSIDTAYIRISRPVEEVFTFMVDSEKLGIWALGAWNATVDETGLIRGVAIAGGSEIFVRIEMDRDHGLIDYYVGQDPDRLTPRIFARTFPGTLLGGTDGECALTMTALRTDDMDDARWQGLQAMHAVEIGLIKAAIETGYDHRKGKPE